MKICSFLKSKHIKLGVALVFALIFATFSQGCKSEDQELSLPKNFIKVYYLFDISGSYHANADGDTSPLRESILKAKEIVLYLAQLQDPKYFPQVHQIGFIGEQVEKNLPGIRIEQQGIFDKPEQGLSNFISSLISIDAVPCSQGTDIYAGLYKASQSLAGSNSVNQLIIIFSDFHPDTQNPSSYKIDLKNIKVFGYYTETGNSLQNPGNLQGDIKSFEQILKTSNCNSFSLLHLDAFDTSQIWDIIHGQ